MTMAKEQETPDAPSSVQYKKFDNEDAVDESELNDVTQNPPSYSQAAPNYEPEQRSRDPIELPQVVMSGPDLVTDSPTAILPQHEVVLQMNGTGQPPTLEQPEEDAWNWLNLVLSVASIFCCTVCGILATVTSVLAYTDHRVRDFDASRKKRVASYALALTALVVGVICMVIVVVVAMHYDHKIH